MGDGRRRLERPSGHAPPDTTVLGELEIDLGPLAREITARFLTRFPDELERYEDPAAVRAWCEHDNRHLLDWASLTRERFVAQLEWLCRVLEHRGYPVARMADDLAIAADVVEERHGDAADELVGNLRAGAEHVRATPSFVSAG